MRYFRTCVIKEGDDGEDCTLHPHDFDLLGFIMELEDGEVTEDDVIVGFQHLIDTGQAWTLQGSYGRMARNLIEAGVCTPRGE